jgi:TRAP-type C4-dicarboxylate transport system permease small subunit
VAVPASLRTLARWCALAGCLSACLTALLTVASIIGRTWLARPIQGDVELTQFGIALCIALCLPWCQLQRGNIIVDFFTQAAPAPVQRGLDRLGALLLGVMLCLLAWRAGAGALAVREAQETSMILGWPMWFSYAALAPGLALSGLIALLQACSGGAGR